jgi:hypothetical protein
VLDVDARAHRAGAGGKVRLDGGDGRLLQEAHQPGRRQHVDALVPERVGGVGRRHDDLDLSHESRRDLHRRLLSSVQRGG